MYVGKVYMATSAQRRMRLHPSESFGVSSIQEVRESLLFLGIGITLRLLRTRYSYLAGHCCEVALGMEQNSLNRSFIVFAQCASVVFLPSTFFQNVFWQFQLKIKRSEQIKLFVRTIIPRKYGQFLFLFWHLQIRTIRTFPSSFLLAQRANYFILAVY